jgi:hypothetical protein
MDEQIAAGFDRPPGGDKDQHHCFIDTGKYQLIVVIIFVQNSPTRILLTLSVPRPRIRRLDKFWGHVTRREKHFRFYKIVKTEAGDQPGRKPKTWERVVHIPLSPFFDKSIRVSAQSIWI